MSDVFREVDEELRQDQFKQLWKRYGTVLVAGALVLVAAVGGFQAWQGWQEERQADLSDRYATALDHLEAGDSAAGQEVLSGLIGDDEAGYGILAAFQQARVMIEADDLDGAVAVWDQVAANQDVPKAFRDVATLTSVLHQLDSGEPAALAERLAPLVEPGQAFRASALELSALVALRRSDKAAARDFYGQVADNLEAPPAMRARATQMLDALGE